jgi:glycosyltransferase involved in cell wall biosynthesis
MKIIHIDTGQVLRGGQRQLLRLAKGLAGRGHAQTIVCPERSDLAREASRDGLRVFALPEHDLLYGHGIVQLRQFLLASATHLLHAHDGRAQTLSWLASWGLPVRRVASRRVTFLPDRRIYHRLIYGRTCHAVIAVSQFVRGLLIESGIPAQRIEVIPDGIEVPEEPPSALERAKARAPLKIAAEEFVVGFLGAATYEKGLDVAMDALAILATPWTRLRFLAMGSFPEAARAELLRRAGEASEKIQFLEPQDDIRPFFSALDLFWMPSRAEGLGSAALMAMAHGVPVVASRVGGLPEVVEDGKTGWLVTAGDAPSLAAITLRAAQQPALLAPLPAAAREKARLFSTAIMVARTERLYQQLI